MTAPDPGPTPVVDALVVAAGRGQRAGEGLPKQYRPLDGAPLLAHALAALAGHAGVRRVVTVIHPDDAPLFAATLASLPESLRARVAAPVFGGASRQDSVRTGLAALAADPPQIVLVHDGARPRLSATLIARAIEAAARHGAAVPALPVTDTIKEIGPAGAIAATPDRSRLRAVQTPQAFAFDLLREAHERAAARGLSATDDAAVVEAAGRPVWTFAGDPANVKFTTPEDFAAAARSPGEVRVGQGVDVHAFAPGDHVWLGGVRLPHDRGVAAHSDGDVLLHALADALYGALADGDIGRHFPPSDPRWKGAASRIFLDHAAGRVRARGGTILSLDATVVCEAPRVGPAREAIRDQIAAICAIAPERVAIKATTSEGLGFPGRREGIAAFATAAIRLPEAP